MSKKTVGSLPIGTQFTISNGDYGVVKVQLIEKYRKEKYCYVVSLTDGIRGTWAISYDCPVLEVL